VTVEVSGRTTGEGSTDYEALPPGAAPTPSPASSEAGGDRLGGNIQHPPVAGIVLNKMDDPCQAHPSFGIVDP
jgi:hypothetical protein